MKNKELVIYLKKYSKDFDLEQIKSKALSNGYSEEDFEEALSQAQGGRVDKKKKKLELELKKGKKMFEQAFPEKKLKRPGLAAVLFLGEKDNADPVIVRESGGMFDYKGKTYHVRNDCKFSFGKKRIPLMILPEWNMTPLGNKSWEDAEMQEKFSRLQDHTINGIRRAERVRAGEKLGTSLSGKAIVGIIIFAIIGFAIISQFI